MEAHGIHIPAGRARAQDSATAASSIALPGALSSQHLPTNTARSTVIEETTSISHTSHPGTPITGSPAKARMRMDPLAADLHEVSHPSTSHSPPNAQPDLINSYSTAGQSVIDTMLIEMLISLRSSLQSDMLVFLHIIDHNMSTLENRVSNVETKGKSLTQAMSS